MAKLKIYFSKKYKYYVLNILKSDVIKLVTKMFSKECL